MKFENIVLSKHRMLLHREDQEVSDYTPGGTPHSLDHPYWGKILDPSPNILDFSRPPAGKVLVGSLF